VAALTTTDWNVRCPAADGGEFSVSARLYREQAAPTAWLILAHGAGAGHDSTFMVDYARAIAARRLAVVTFNFPYIERGRRVPDPRGTLEACWTAMIAAVRQQAGRAAIVAGGKSMGGRIASQVAANPAVAPDLAGLVFLGYPLHPPGRLDQRRTAHWPDVRVPVLFIQGSRDTFASPDELREEMPRLRGRATLVVVEGGDHSFKVPRSARRPQDLAHQEIQQAVADWVASLSTSR
jgi:uncharacterized protein